MPNKYSSLLANKRFQRFRDNVETQPDGTLRSSFFTLDPTKRKQPFDVFDVIAGTRPNRQNSPSVLWKTANFLKVQVNSKKIKLRKSTTVFMNHVLKSLNPRKVKLPPGQDMCHVFSANELQHTMASVMNFISDPRKSANLRDNARDAVVQMDSEFASSDEDASGKATRKDASEMRLDSLQSPENRLAAMDWLHDIFASTSRNLFGGDKNTNRSIKSNRDLLEDVMDVLVPWVKARKVLLNGVQHAAGIRHGKVKLDSTGQRMGSSKN